MESKQEGRGSMSSEPIIIPAHLRHGQTNVYNNLGCRCVPCKLAWREYQMPKVINRKAKGLAVDDERHGTYSGYANYGCRCERCVEANRLYALDYQVRRGKMTKEKAVGLGWVEKNV